MNENIKTRHESCSEKVCPADSGQKRSDEFSPALGNKKLKGSLTLEACLSLPFFMMLCGAVISFLVICALQINIQIRMEETARVMGKTAFLLEYGASSDRGTGFNTSDPGSSELSAVNAGLNSAGIKQMLVQGDLAAKLDRSGIEGGAAGLYTHNSSFNEGNGILDIVTEYDYSVPWIPVSLNRIRLAQRMRSHAWTGRRLSSMAGGTGGDGERQDPDENTVYITPTGNVYHLSPSCHYLDLSIRAVSFSSVPEARNADGEKYSGCPKCSGKGHSDTVFITDYGSDWHSSLECSGLKRTVMEKNISEVENMRMCSKCRNGQHEHD